MQPETPNHSRVLTTVSHDDVVQIKAQGSDSLKSGVQGWQSKRERERKDSQAGHPNACYFVSLFPIILGDQLVIFCFGRGLHDDPAASDGTGRCLTFTSTTSSRVCATPWRHLSGHLQPRHIASSVHDCLALLLHPDGPLFATV